jgi:AcrR family transcriptional regulator
VSASARDTTRRRGPRPGGEDTREALVVAAREEFAEKGFAAATVRSIGARAGVDPAMISHYFGGKAGLFREITHIPLDPASGLDLVLAGPRDQLGLRLATHILGIWEQQEFREPVLALVRSALSEPGSERALREYFESQLLPRVAAVVRGPDPQRQAALAAAHVVGVVLGRHVLGLGVLAAPPIDELARQIAPAVQEYLDGHRWPGGAPGGSRIEPGPPGEYVSTHAE